MKIKIAEVESTAYQIACKETALGGRELEFRTDGSTVHMTLSRKDILQLTAVLMYSSPDPVTQLEVPSADGA